MKRYINFLLITFFLLVGFLVKPTKMYAITSPELCTSLGGECANSIACVGEKTFVADSNGVPINCGTTSGCCKTKEEFQNECELAGGKCFNNNPGSTYTPLNKTCDSGSCYKQITVAAPCSSPAICTYAPGGCPTGTKIAPGLCTGFNYVCCVDDGSGTAKSTITNPLTLFNLPANKKYCDSSGNPVIGPTERLYTAIGCIRVSNLEDLVSDILKWAIGIGGGVAFLLIIYSGIMIMTSSGNPERLKAGQELLTSAIAGLIMLIFSVFILRVIGVDILKIPGI